MRDAETCGDSRGAMLGGIARVCSAADSRSNPIAPPPAAARIEQIRIPTIILNVSSDTCAFDRVWFRSSTIECRQRTMLPYVRYTRE